jgi:hypothetical protein
MDTLVINVSPRPGIIRDALEKVQRDRADFVEWFRVYEDATQRLLAAPGWNSGHGSNPPAVQAKSAFQNARKF